MPKTSKKDTKKKTKQKDVKKMDPKHSEKEKSKDLEEQLKVIQDKHIRLKAEFENFRRRKADEISRLLQFEGENTILGFLPILDDLERMIHSSDASEESLKNGISMVESSDRHAYRGRGKCWCWRGGHGRNGLCNKLSGRDRVGAEDIDLFAFGEDENSSNKF